MPTMDVDRRLERLARVYEAADHAWMFHRGPRSARDDAREALTEAVRAHGTWMRRATGQIYQCPAEGGGLLIWSAGAPESPRGKGGLRQDWYPAPPNSQRRVFHRHERGKS